MPSSSKKQHDFMEAIAHNKAFAKKAGVPQSVGKDFSNADKGKTFKQGGLMKHEKEHELNQAKELRRIAKEEEQEAKEMKHGGHTGHHVKKMAMGGRGMNPKLAAMIAAGAGRPPMRPPMGSPMGPAGMPPGGGMPPPAMGPGMKHGGLSKAHHKHLAEHHLAMAEHHHSMHEGGKTHKYAKGGAIETMGPRSMMEDVEAGSNKHGKFGESKLQKRGHTRGKNLGDSGKIEPIESEKNMKSFEKEGMKKGGKVHKFAEGGHIGSKVHSRADGIAKKGHTRTKIC
jgi:hypothetical protein